MAPDWNLLLAYAVPVVPALLLGLLARSLLLRLAQRMEGREQRAAGVIRVVAVPAAIAVPALLLQFALDATPMPESLLQLAHRLLHYLLIICLTWLAVRVIMAGEQAILRRNPLDTDDNLESRRIQTQTRVLARILMGIVILIGAALILMQNPAVQKIGSAMLASAGLIGLVAGIAARPVFGNLIAGLQIALTQPIRLNDVVIVEGEWGRIEWIGSAYVVVRIWDQRRMVVPLTWFIDNPFQNWTRSSSDLLGTVMLWLDYRTPVGEVRAELERICRDEPLWDGRVCVTQITETSEQGIQVRLLVSVRNSGDAFDLRCIVRERMIDFLVREHPYALPRVRAELSSPGNALPPRSMIRGQATRSPGAADGGTAPGVPGDQHAAG